MIERGGLEIRCTVYPYRGFESLTFRCFIQWDAIIRIPFCISDLENSFTTKRLLTRNVSPLMPINCLVNCPINRRGKETKRRRDKKKKGQRQKPRKPLEEYGGYAVAVMLPFWSYKSKLLTPNRQHPPCLLSEGCHSLQGD